MRKLLASENNSLLYRFLAAHEKDDKTIKRQAGIIHRTISTAARVIFLVSLVVTACFYPKMPAETGVHFIGLAYMPETHGLSEALHRIFTEYQEIDVISSKALLFYPHVVTLVMLLAGLLPRLAKKIKAKNLSESARVKITEALRISLDIAGLIFAVYFCGIWTVQILRQQPMRVLFTELYAVLTLLTFFDLIIFTVMITNDEHKNGGTKHDDLETYGKRRI